jgi:hypothetical protein
LIYNDWSKLFVRFIQSGYTHSCVNKYAGYTVCATWLRLFLHELNKNYDQSLNTIFVSNAIYQFWHCIQCQIFSLSVLDSNVVDRGMFEHLSGSNKQMQLVSLHQQNNIYNIKFSGKIYDHISINKTTSTTSSFHVRFTIVSPSTKQYLQHQVLR